MNETDAKELTWGWWLVVLAGLLSVVAGLIIIFKPSDSLSTLAVIAGIFILVDGILELATAFMHSTQNRGLTAVFGVITAIIGVLLIRHPVGGVEAVALLIGLWLIAVGVIRFVTAFDESADRGWHALAGVVELVAGIAIIVNPDIGFSALALVVGIGFILNGIVMGVIGWGMHEVRDEATRPLRV